MERSKKCSNVQISNVTRTLSLIEKISTVSQKAVSSTTPTARTMESEVTRRWKAFKDSLVQHTKTVTCKPNAPLDKYYTAATKVLNEPAATAASTMSAAAVAGG